MCLLSVNVLAQSVFSDFSTSSDGWVIMGQTGQHSVQYVSTGGNPAGYIRGDFSLDNKWVFSAPAKFTGNKLSAYNHSLSFDLLLDGLTNPQFDDADIILTGGGEQIVYDVPKDIYTGWQSYTVILNENEGWHLTNLLGAPPTADIMKLILTNLTQLEIRGKYSTGSGTCSLDNVYLGISQAYSNFDMNYEGWRVVGDVQGGTGMPNYHSTGGHPGGYLSAKDDATGGTWYWRAPGKFLGNISAAYNQTLKYDLKQSGLNNQFDEIDVILQGSALKLVYNTPNNPDTAWTSYSLNLSENSGWHINDTLGIVPTKSEFLDVLSNLQELWIRGEFINGPDSGCLDNVSLGFVQGISDFQLRTQEVLSIFPNPASDYTTLRFTVADPGYFNLFLLNINGLNCVPSRMVYCTAGVHEIQLVLKDLPSGIYFPNLRGDKQTMMGKVIVK